MTKSRIADRMIDKNEWISSGVKFAEGFLTLLAQWYPSQVAVEEAKRSKEWALEEFGISERTFRNKAEKCGLKHCDFWNKKRLYWESDLRRTFE